MNECRMSWVLGVVVALPVLLGGPVSAQDLPRAGPASVGMSSERLARFDSTAQALVDSSAAGGIAVLVLRNGRVAKSGAWGWRDREARELLSEDDLFRIASQTKAITSVAVMMLVEEGRLALHHPVARWVPSFDEMTVATDSGPVPTRRPVTIRDLLTHTAGISYGTGPLIRDAYEAAGLGPAAGYGWYFAGKDEPICTTMDRLGTLPLAAQPGERFVYGYATDLLGCVVERISGVSLDEFFRERIFEPLAMDDTWFYLPPSERSRLVTVYSDEPEGLRRAPDGAGGQGHYVEGPRTSYSGGAGLVSTIGDYGKFLQMMLNGGELNGVYILSPHSVALMTEDHLGPAYSVPGQGFGLGFQILTDPGLAGRYGRPGLYGWGGAYATTYWVDPMERLVVLVMTQTLPSRHLDADVFRALVYSAILEPAGALR